MEEPQSLLAQASAAAGRGDKLAARRLLDELIINEPNNEQAWLLLAEVVDDFSEVSDCLQHALAIDPQNQAAKQEYNKLLDLHPELVKLDPAKAEKVDKAEAAKEAKAGGKIDVLYNQAYQAAWDGDKKKAESVLDELLAQYPLYEPGWILLSQVASNPEKVEKCLRRVLAIMPDNQAAGKSLSKIMAEKERSRIDPG